MSAARIAALLALVVALPASAQHIRSRSAPGSFSGTDVTGNSFTASSSGNAFVQPTNSKDCLNGATCTTYIQSDGTTITEAGNVSVTGSLSASTVTASTSVQTPDIKGAGGADRILLPSASTTTLYSMLPAGSGSTPAFRLDTTQTYGSNDRLFEIWNGGAPTGFRIMGNASVQIGNYSVNGGTLSINGNGVSATLKGNATDGASAVSNIIDTATTLATTGAEALSLRNGGTEQAALKKDANGWNWRVEGKPAVTYNQTSANAKTMLSGFNSLTSGSASFTFPTAFAATPVCTCTDNTATAAVKCSSSTTAITIAGTGSDTVGWICIGDR